MSAGKFPQLPLSCSHYSCISKHAKTVNATFNTKIKRAIRHLAIYFTGFKVCSEGE
ncbi:Mobile element protein [Candidatus Enterovibrio altilux]|uniref:Mobile element protein n=1 Tax=Candidatus Enterovibrio altilux TaxID=1927128 RepID=A0A291B7Y3_9GAMM|nr:Mobile element protein [Candidatus Enterovibrio luxaltus]